MDPHQTLAVEASDRPHLSPTEADSLTVEGDDSVRVRLDDRDAAVSVVLVLDDDWVTEGTAEATSATGSAEVRLSGLQMTVWSDPVGTEAARLLAADLGT